MSFADWVKNGWLVAHKSSKQEIANLLGIVARDLKDSQAKDVSDDWRFAIAYNAALQAATAALAASGYRAGRDSHHYRVIQSLELTVGKDAKFIGAIREVAGELGIRMRSELIAKTPRPLTLYPLYGDLEKQVARQREELRSDDTCF